MDVMQLLRVRAHKEAESALFWAKKASEEYGKEFQQTKPNGIFTRLWREAYTRRDMLFEILAEAEEEPLTEIMRKYDCSYIRNNSANE